MSTSPSATTRVLIASSDSRFPKEEPWTCLRFVRDAPVAVTLLRQARVADVTALSPCNHLAASLASFLAARISFPSDRLDLTKWNQRLGGCDDRAAHQNSRRRRPQSPRKPQAASRRQTRLLKAAHNIHAVLGLIRCTPYSVRPPLPPFATHSASRTERHWAKSMFNISTHMGPHTRPQVGPRTPGAAMTTAP